MPVREDSQINQLPITNNSKTKKVMATKKTTKVNKNMSNNNETKVVCPVCGSEFAIDEHEHTVKNAIAVGKDSGMGTVYLPVSKRGEALQAAGIDTSKYFSINLPTGGTQMMKMGDDGKAVPVTSDDPVIQSIMAAGTVPNRSLFRRWVMSQVFHGLMYESRYSGDGFMAWLKMHGYKYQWEMLLEELRVQAKLYGKDMENFAARNRWFNRELCVKMAEDYIKQLRDDAKNRPQHKCKGVPYVRYDFKDYFLSDIEKKLVEPMKQQLYEVKIAKTPQLLYEAVCRFCHSAHLKVAFAFNQCAAWKDAYKGMGAYATMQNLLRFHGCTFPKDNDFYKRGVDGLVLLEQAAQTYEDGDGWRLFGLMKQMLDENGIDIKAKMKEWAKAKKNRG